MKNFYTTFDNYDSIKSEIDTLAATNMTHKKDTGVVKEIIARYHPKKIEYTVDKIISVTATAKTIRLKSKNGYLPPFIAGQYINIAVTAQGVQTSRPYSLSSSPLQRDYYEITVRVKKDGFVSDYLLNELKEGDSLTSGGPSGNFTYNPIFMGNKIVFIAGGSGITPFKSIMEYYSGKNPSSEIHLIYGCADPDDIIFKDTLEELAKAPGVFTHIIISNPPEGYQGDTGFITADYIEKCVGNPAEYRYFLCGPEVMYRFCLDELSSKLKIQENHIRREVQTASDSPDQMPGWPENVSPQDMFTVTVKDGKSFKVRAGEPLLNALEKYGVTRISECRSGECSYCRTKLISGNVFYGENAKIRKSDVKFGYIHPCVSYTVSDIEILL